MSMNPETKDLAKQAMEEGVEKSKTTTPSQQTVSDKVRDYLLGYEANIAAALGHSDPIKVRKVLEQATILIAQDSALQQCAKASIVAAVLQASSLNLDVSKISNLVYFIPRWNSARGQNEVQVSISYQGYIELAHRSGKVASIEAGVVCTGDSFEYEFGTSPNLSHLPLGMSDNVEYAYAIATMKGGNKQFVVMSHDEIEKLRTRDKKAQGDKPRHVWATDYHAMAKAKAVRQLCKYLPKLPELVHFESAPDDYMKYFNDEEENQ